MGENQLSELEDQFSELEMLSAMYPDECELCTPAGASIEIIDPHGRRWTLRLSLPPEYPDGAAPLLELYCAQVAKSVVSRLQLQLREAAAEAVGEPQLAGLVQQTRELTAAEPSSAQPEKPKVERRLVRRFFWTHHTRRKQLLVYRWAAELRLGGILTVSKPGYMLIEGEEPEMSEFTKRNMREPWKEIKITWHEECGGPGQDPEALRLFSDGLREVSVEQFITELRQRDQEEALEMGTRGAVPRRAHGRIVNTKADKT